MSFLKSNSHWLIIFFLIISCTPEINFEEPQPEGDRNELKFRNKFQGSYLSMHDSAILTVYEDKIVQKWHLVIEVPKAEFDTTEGIEIRDGMIYSKEIPEPLPFRQHGDTIVIDWDFDLTIFDISPDQVLRYYKGLYFLNYKKPDNFWNVKVVSLNRKGILQINKVYGGQQQIEGLKQITEVDDILDESGNVVAHKIHPTRRELKDILKSDAFREGSEFQKIKINK